MANNDGNNGVMYNNEENSNENENNENNNSNNNVIKNSG
jgi:hypothetical protein